MIMINDDFDNPVEVSESVLERIVYISFLDEKRRASILKDMEIRPYKYIGEDPPARKTYMDIFNEFKDILDEGCSDEEFILYLSVYGYQARMPEES